MLFVQRFIYIKKYSKSVGNFIGIFVRGVVSRLLIATLLLNPSSLLMKRRDLGNPTLYRIG